MRFLKRITFMFVVLVGILSTIFPIVMGYIYLTILSIIGVILGLYGLWKLSGFLFKK